MAGYGSAKKDYREWLLAGLRMKAARAASGQGQTEVGLAGPDQAQTYQVQPFYQGQPFVLYPHPSALNPFAGASAGGGTQPAADPDQLNKQMMEWFLDRRKYEPEWDKLERQQSAIDALRARSQSSIEANPLTRRVVAMPHWTQGVGNVAQGLRAGYDQRRQNADVAKLHAEELAYLRKQLGLDVAERAGKTEVPDEESDPQNPWRALPKWWRGL